MILKTNEDNEDWSIFNSKEKPNKCRVCDAIWVCAIRAEGYDSFVSTTRHPLN